MIKLKQCCLIFISLVFSQLYSQTTININQEKITSALDEYFKMDRENIHLHLNKNTFLTDEEVWFKGYVIEKKTNIPFIATSNVYVTLLDPNGQKIATQLYYAENSIFSGRIKLNPTLSSGKYYLQVFTNYMNNFSEDESSTYEITIVNPLENNYVDTKVINYNDITIAFHPESGTFLEGISNTIGVKISDCNDNGISVKNAEIVDSKGNLITNFSTNANGFGRFDILYTNNEVYKAILEINDIKIEKNLPQPSLEGITFSVNNYTFKDKTTIKLKTNSITLQELKEAPNTLVIAQNQTASFISFSFKKNETERSFTIPNEKLAEGINTINLINASGKKIGERIIYKPYPISNKIDLIVSQKRNDSIVISGKSSMLLSNLSISVLPSETVSEIPEKSIYSSFLLDNFLLNPTKNSNYYLNDLTRVKHFELDNFLLTSKSKYDWNTTQGNPPQEKYTFDRGLNIKGTVNNNLSEIDSHKINLDYALLGLNETTALNNKNEFLFENILAIDSTSIYFTLVNKKLKATELKLYSQITNNNRKFLKPFIIHKKPCIKQNSNAFSDNTPFPKIKNAIQLDSITIFAKRKKEKLNNLNIHNNSAAKGYKITENVASLFRDVLGFIRSHGYNVSVEGGNVIISRQYTNSFNADRSPVIYLDDVLLNDFSILLNYNLDYVDEIYVNKMGYGAGILGANGTIRIYSKTESNGRGIGIKVKSKPFIVKDGFQPFVVYENPKYDNTQDVSFLKFGSVHWKPNVETDADGMFQFSIPNLFQSTIKVIIEGISSDGKLISETKTVTIQN